MGTNGNDRVDAGRGNDYVSTGYGNDTIYANGNDSTWRGTSGDAYLNGGTNVDAGWGDDHILLGTGARPSIGRFFGPDGGGSFNVQIGDRQDRVSVYDVDFVSIYAYDSDHAQDRFYFGASFDGDAVLHGVDSFDRVDLRGGDWALISTANAQLVYQTRPAAACFSRASPTASTTRWSSCSRRSSWRRARGAGRETDVPRWLVRRADAEAAAPLPRSHQLAATGAVRLGPRFWRARTSAMSPIAAVNSG